MNHKPLTIVILLFVVLSSTLSSEVSAGLEGILYEETMETYTRIEGETLRWDLSREFLIRNYEEITYERGGNMVPGIQMEIVDDSQNGQYETIIEPFLGMNFEIEIIRLSNGDISEFRWDMFLFRSESLYNGFPNAYFAYDNKHFDLENEKNFFSVNLEYTEFLNSSGNIKELAVNTELSSKNNDDGRTTRTAIHMIKRIDGTVVFEYNWVINEVSTLPRYFNFIDQPYLWVPLQLGAVIVAILIYLRIHKFWVNNDIRIIRGKNRIITIEEIDEETNNSEVSSPNQSDNKDED